MNLGTRGIDAQTMAVVISAILVQQPTLALRILRLYRRGSLRPHAVLQAEIGQVTPMDDLYRVDEACDACNISSWRGQ